MNRGNSDGIITILSCGGPEKTGNPHPRHITGPIHFVCGPDRRVEQAGGEQYTARDTKPYAVLNQANMVAADRQEPAGEVCVCGATQNRNEAWNGMLALRPSLLGQMWWSFVLPSPIFVSTMALSPICQCWRPWAWSVVFSWPRYWQSKTDGASVRQIEKPQTDPRRPEREGGESGRDQRMIFGLQKGSSMVQALLIRRNGGDTCFQDFCSWPPVFTSFSCCSRDYRVWCADCWSCVASDIPKTIYFWQLQW